MDFDKEISSFLLGFSSLNEPEKKWIHNEAFCEFFSFFSLKKNISKKSLEIVQKEKSNSIKSLDSILKLPNLQDLILRDWSVSENNVYISS